MNLYVSYNYSLGSLPVLPDSIQALYCVYTGLTYLPELPTMLSHLYCSDNNLTSLPILPERLIIMYCKNNPMRFLPDLPYNLFCLSCNDDLSEIYTIKIEECFILKNEKVKIINRFRELFYSLKFKNQFRKILWEKIREPKIQKMYSPKNLTEFLNENEQEDLDKW
jgi:Leucine-rich repeat (LRR) protein